MSAVAISLFDGGMGASLRAVTFYDVVRWVSYTLDDDAPDTRSLDRAS